MSTKDGSSLRNVQPIEPHADHLPAAVGVVGEFQVGAAQIHRAGIFFFSVIVAAVHPGAGNCRARCAAAATAVGLYYFPGSGGVAIVTSIARLISDIGVIIVTVYIGTYTISIGVANAEAGGRRTGAHTIRVVDIIGGSRIPIVTGAARVGNNIGVGVAINSALFVDAQVIAGSLWTGSAPEINSCRDRRPTVEARAGTGQPEVVRGRFGGVDELRVRPEPIGLKERIGIPVLLKGIIAINLGSCGCAEIAVVVKNDVWWYEAADVLVRFGKIENVILKLQLADAVLQPDQVAGAYPWSDHVVPYPGIIGIGQLQAMVSGPGDHIIVGPYIGDLYGEVANSLSNGVGV